jgi:hypothetical protein
MNPDRQSSNTSHPSWIKPSTESWESLFATPERIWSTFAGDLEPRVRREVLKENTREDAATPMLDYFDLIAAGEPDFVNDATISAMGFSLDPKKFLEELVELLLSGNTAELEARVGCRASRRSEPPPSRRRRSLP